MTTITIQTINGPQKIDVNDENIIGDFCVHVDISPEEDGFSVTHIPSGMSVPIMDRDGVHYVWNAIKDARWFAIELACDVEPGDIHKMDDGTWRAREQFQKKFRRICRVAFALGCNS
jgi:hypothetical protein